MSIGHDRRIQPEWFLRYSDLAPQALLLFLALQCHMDRKGRASYDARFLKSVVAPQMPSADFDIAIRELQDRGLVFIYEVEGQAVIQYLDWQTLQKVYDKERVYDLPEPDANHLLGASEGVARKLQKLFSQHSNVCSGSENSRKFSKTLQNYPLARDKDKDRDKANRKNKRIQSDDRDSTGTPIEGDDGADEGLAIPDDGNQSGLRISSANPSADSSARETKCSKVAPCSRDRYPLVHAVRDHWNATIRKANDLPADDTGTEGLHWIKRRNEEKGALEAWPDGIPFEDMKRAITNYGIGLRDQLANGLPRPIALANFFGTNFRAEPYLAPDFKPAPGKRSRHIEGAPPAAPAPAAPPQNPPPLQRDSARWDSVIAALQVESDADGWAKWIEPAEYLGHTDCDVLWLRAPTKLSRSRIYMYACDKINELYGAEDLEIIVGAAEGNHTLEEN